MRTRPALLPVLLLGLGLAPAAAHAQDGFLFGAPDAQLVLRAGPVLPRAQSDVFDFITSEVTLARSDFRTPALGADLALLLGPRVDMTIGITWAESERTSELREWVDENDEPIRQTTTVRTIPLTIGARLYPFERGQAISDLAWLPARITPYVGAGVGMTWYALRMEGEFVNETDLTIFADDYESDGSAITAYVQGGLDYWLSARLGLNLDARYGFGSADLNDDFRSYDSIDLNGLQASAGLSIRW